MDNEQVEILNQVLMNSTMATYEGNRQFIFDIILNAGNDQIRKELTKQICAYMEKVLTDKKPNSDLQLSITSLVKDLMLHHPKLIANSLLASKAPDALVDLIFRQNTIEKEVAVLATECLFKWAEAYPLDKNKKPTNFSALVQEMKGNGIRQPLTYKHFGAKPTVPSTPAPAIPTPGGPSASERKELKIKPGQELQPVVKTSLSELAKATQKIRAKLNSLQENDILKELRVDNKEIINSKKGITILQNKALQSEAPVLSDTLTDFMMEALIFCERFQKLYSDLEHGKSSEEEVFKSMYQETGNFLNLAQTCRDLKGSLSLQSSMQPSQFEVFTPGGNDPLVAQPYKSPKNSNASAHFEKAEKEAGHFMAQWSKAFGDSAQKQQKQKPGGTDDFFKGFNGGGEAKSSFEPFQFRDFEMNEKPASFSQVFGSKEKVNEFDPDQPEFNYKPTWKQKPQDTFAPKPPVYEKNAYDALKAQISGTLIQPIKTFKKASELLYDETFNGSVSKYSLRDFSQGVNVTKTKYSGRTIAFDDSFYQQFDQVQNSYKGQTLRKFKTSNLKKKGILYETEELQIGFKSSLGQAEALEKQFIRVDLFIGNKTGSPLCNPTYQISKKPGVVIYTNVGKEMPDIPSGRQGLLSLVFFIEESKMINMRQSFVINGKASEARFFLPCLIIKKIQFQKVKVDDFRREWRALKSTMIRTPIFNMSKIIGNLSSLQKYTASFTKMTSLETFLDGKQEFKLCSVAKLELDRVLVKLRLRANHTAVVQVTGRCNTLIAEQILHSLQFILGAQH